MQQLSPCLPFRNGNFSSHSSLNLCIQKNVTNFVVLNCHCKPFTFTGLCQWCCELCFISRMSQRLGEQMCLPCCVPGAVIILRGKLRMLLGIQVRERENNQHTVTCTIPNTRWSVPYLSAYKIVGWQATQKLNFDNPIR